MWLQMCDLKSRDVHLLSVRELKSKGRRLHIWGRRHAFSDLSDLNLDTRACHLQWTTGTVSGKTASCSTGTKGHKLCCQIYSCVVSTRCVPDLRNRVVPLSSSLGVFVPSEGRVKIGRRPHTAPRLVPPSLCMKNFGVPSQVHLPLPFSSLENSFRHWS